MRLIRLAMRKLFAPALRRWAAAIEASSVSAADRNRISGRALAEVDRFVAVGDRAFLG
ncbi:hypothetical protein [Sinorhizobium fredii]|uniref:hypothetical protein n=1 Tax=Rhizobium fredii TaxID=380 RepID=UPI0035128624